MEPPPQLEGIGALVGEWDVTVEPRIGDKSLISSGTAETSWNRRRRWLASTSRISFPGASQPIQARELVAWNDMVKRRPARNGADESAESALEGPLRVLDFYVGRIVPAKATEGEDWSSEVLLTPGVGGLSLRFVGQWDREGFAAEFVDGLMAWDPGAEVIRISAVFFHGAYFDGEVRVLDASRQVLQRDWTGKFPDGRRIRFKETWTPVSEDEFEWKIEHFLDGEWRFHLPPGVTKAPIHRVERP